MARRSRNTLTPLRETPEVRKAAGALLDVVAEASAAHAMTPEAYARAVKETARLRGQALAFPVLLSGSGRGARVRLADGSTLLDFLGGTGLYAFGHSDRDLLETAVIASATDAALQGPLLPGVEQLRLARALLRHAGPSLRHAWLSASSAGANESALKMIFRRHAPADRIVVFEGAFAGRTTTLAELSDRPEEREGLPLRGNVLHVPFYDPADPEGSTERSLRALDEHLARYPGRIAGMGFELVQGEAGVRTAPASFFARLMDRCREAEIAVWVDEAETCGRTGELFAFRTLGLEERVDVATAGRALQGGAALFSRAYAPRRGPGADEVAGATAGLAVGARVVERLEEEGFLGAEGRIAVLGRRVAKRFESLSRRLPRAVGPRSGMGALQAFVPFDGAPEVADAVVQAAFEEGLLVDGAGHRPRKIRMHLPVNTTDEELEAAFTVLEKALRRVAEARALPC